MLLLASNHIPPSVWVYLQPKHEFHHQVFMWLHETVRPWCWTWYSSSPKLRSRKRHVLRFKVLINHNRDMSIHIHTLSDVTHTITHTPRSKPCVSDIQQGVSKSDYVTLYTNVTLGFLYSSLQLAECWTQPTTWANTLLTANIPAFCSLATHDNMRLCLVCGLLCPAVVIVCVPAAQKLTLMISNWCTVLLRWSLSLLLRNFIIVLKLTYN